MLNAKGRKRYPPKENISIQEACKRFSVCSRTIRRVINKHGLKKIKTGREMFVNRLEIGHLFNPIKYPAILKSAQPKRSLRVSRLKIIMACEGFTESKEFRAYEIGKQLKWIEANMKRFTDNQDHLGGNGFTDWGKLSYNSSPIRGTLMIKPN